MAAHPAVGWLKADNAAAGRGYADRPAGIGAGRPGAQAELYRSPRTAARTAAGAARVPWIARGTEHRALIRRTVGEFMRVQLPQHHRPGFAVAGDDGGILVRHEVLAQARAGGGP